jgi:hypothetical protein
MFSNERKGLDYPRSQSILLSRQQFEVVFQVTHQILNFQESRLLGLGYTAHDLDLLIDSLGSINDRIEGCSRVRIDIIPKESTASLPQSIDAMGDEAHGGSTMEVQGVLPLRIAVGWKSLTELVVSALGPRELFLRTGYNFDEVKEAIEGIVVA